MTNTIKFLGCYRQSFLLTSLTTLFCFQLRLIKIKENSLQELNLNFVVVFLK